MDGDNANDAQVIAAMMKESKLSAELRGYDAYTPSVTTILMESEGVSREAAQILMMRAVIRGFVEYNERLICGQLTERGRELARHVI